MLKKEWELNKNVETHHLLAFAYEGKGGNAAGVTVDLNGQMSECERQALAAQLGYSESAFVLPSTNADFKVLFYTPTRRVPMCGHATVATWNQLFQMEIVTAGTYTQEIIKEDNTSEVLTVTVDANGVVYTELPAPQFKNTVAPELVADIFAVPTDTISNDDLAPTVVNTGFDDLMIPIPNRATFESILFEELSEEAIRIFQEKQSVEALHIFCLETETVFIASAKNTDPINGIFPYDNATGTSNGALVCYLLNRNIISAHQAEEGVAIRQIGLGGAVSQVLVKVEFDKGSISRVLVGGVVIRKID